MTGRVCDGKVALVTGASQGGTGTAIAVRLAAEGAKVAITARSVEGLEATRARIEGHGGECVVLPADLGDPHGGRRNLVSLTEDAFGPIDILVNNAAVNGYRPFETVSAARLELSLQVNLWAPWELMSAVIDGMRERGRGAIVNLTTFSAELPPGPPFPTNKPAKGGFVYGAAKAALNRLTIAAASECEGQGISVNALTPQAAIATPALVEAGQIDEAMFEPLETMAEAALALCEGDPNVLTGRIAYSLQLLLELRRPVLDLHGEDLVKGWQPGDLPAIIARQEDNLLARGWPDAYTFGRVTARVHHCRNNEDQIMSSHDRLAAHEFIHHWWFNYDEGHLELLAGLLTDDCHLRSRTETGKHPHEEFIRADNHGAAAAMAWTKQHRAHSPYPLRHQAANVHVVAERGDEIDLESYLFVTQILERKPSTLSTGIVHLTLRLTEDGYRLRYKDVVLDSIESAPFHEVPQVADRQERW